MGQGFSKGNNVIIRTEKQHYATGDVLQGAVALNVIEPMDVDQIGVTFKGKELAWVQRTQSNGTTTTTYTERKRYTFYTVDIPLVSDTRTLQPGQHQFNFSVQIPDSVPPTFREGGSSGGAVYYTLKATVKRRGRFASNMTSKAPVLVYDGGRLLNPQPEEDEVHQEIMNCCFFKSGDAVLKVGVDSNTIRGGDCLDIRLKSSSNSTASFKRMKIRLRGILAISTRGDPVKKSARTRKWTVAKEEKDFELDMGQAKERTVQLPIPAAPAVNLVPTYKGHLLNAYYLLEVEVLTARCIKNIKVILPIVCVPAPIQAATPTRPPIQVEPVPSVEPVSPEEPVVLPPDDAPVVEEWKPTHVYTPKEVAAMNNANTSGPVWRRR